MSTDKYKTSYIFTPDTVESDGRPAKRRKLPSKEVVNGHGEDRSSGLAFPSLFGGAENAACVELRSQLYKKLWLIAEQKISVCIYRYDLNSC